MSWTLEAFRSSLASGATDVLQQVTYISAGAILAPSASGLQVSAMLSKLHSIFGVGAHLENISPQAASMLPLPYPNLAPNNIGTAAESPARFWDWSRNPKPLRPTETFNIYASQTSGGAENEAIFVQFTDGNVQAPPALATGPAISGNGMYTVAHATATTTLTANAFTQITPALDLPLPAGMYALVGARVQSAGCLAFRMKPIADPLWRPGGVGTQTADQLEAPGQRFINPLTGAISHWGVWLTFFQNTIPNIDIWSTSADTKEDIWFDLVKLSDITTSNAL
jgi:hypothetical protein